MQLNGPAVKSKLTDIPVEPRQQPVPCAHQSGSVAWSVVTSTCDARPTNCGSACGAMNDATAVNGAPALTLQANVWFATPKVPQSFHDRLMPPADAIEAPRTS